MIDINDSRIKFALNAVRSAACLAGDIQREMVPKAITKDDRSPVTVADFAAQAVVGYLLEQSFPGSLLVGEEAAAVLRSPTERDNLEQITGFVNRVIPRVAAEQVCDLIDQGMDEPGQNYWTLDPIDGTKGFLRGAQYAAALAYVENGVVQLGVLGCPNMLPDLREEIGGSGSLAVAKRGQGSWITTLRDQPTRDKFSALAVSTRSNPEEARLMRSFESGHTNTSQIDDFQSTLGGKVDPVRMDSQVKYVLLASGEAEIYLRLLSPDRTDYREKIWDQAAGSIIVEEAGGMVTDLDGKVLDFSQGRTLKMNRGICASNGFVHEKALVALKEVKA
ncbi:MAG: 3'(2'),5'-bisphosphate nucleotidase [Anaerolineales bacterium]|nr:MAG: 3'(2'),5'-bisphosphate nucleotidase [Anaerolineales bacterium]